MKRILSEVWVEKELLSEMSRISRMLDEHVLVSADARRADIGRLRQFIRTRRSQFEPELEGDHPEWPEIKPYFGVDRPPIEIEGTFSAKIIPSFPRGPKDFGRAEFKVKVGGKEVPGFKQVMSFAMPEMPSFIRPGYPMLSISGRHPETDANWSLSFYLDPIRVPLEKPAIPVDHFAAWAVLFEGDAMSPDTPRTLFGIGGGMTIEKFGAKPGEIIAGSFKISTGPMPTRRKSASN